AKGGQTIADSMNPKCRFDHNHKTYSDWVDDQYRDETGRLVVDYITPEGLVLPGPPETLEDLFPGLRRYRFSNPPIPPPATDAENVCGTTVSQSRLAAKHARRRHERARNSARRTARPTVPRATVPRPRSGCVEPVDSEPPY
ncbi:MAG: HNH endonuclease, partial [Gordonia sp. (in: high G+C Gram-positive bacteria)]